VIIGDRVADVLIESGGEFNHGFTYSGHPVGCALALENIRILQEEGVIDRVRTETAPHLARQFHKLADHPVVAITEALGMVAGLVLAPGPQSRFDPADEVGMICRRHCFENGVIMRAVGDRMIIAPPLVISPQQIDEMMALIRRCLDLTHVEVRARGLI
jgi:putrescine aminotransferase